MMNPNQHPEMKATMPAAVQVRPAKDSDIGDVQQIYHHEVLEGTASFELEPPSVEEMLRRFHTVREGGYPYLVAVMEGRIAGYAYVVAYRARPAYRYTVENSVYVARWARRRGVASTLLEALLTECESRKFRQMIAVIGDSAHVASIELHLRAGFRMVGTLEDVGYKFHRWLDTVIMQRALGPGAASGPSLKES
jgi:L-amino acid N-acyltransferase YncA